MSSEKTELTEDDAAPESNAKRSGLLITAVLLVAAAVRLWKLDSLPPALFRDEAEKALNGWFLLQGGVDASGRPWPVFIEVFGVTTSAIYQYAAAICQAVGGLNEWTTRLPAAIVGVLTVFFTWLVCRHVWGSKTAVWAAAYLAISPWHVPLSRWAQQGIFLPLFFVIAAWAMARFLVPDRSPDDADTLAADRVTLTETPDVQHSGNAAWLMLAGACAALTMYTYDPARLFAPLLALAAVVLWWRVWLHRWKAVLGAAVVFSIFALPVIWLMTTQTEAAQARFRFLSVFQPGVGPFAALVQFAKNYLAHFSPSFLIVSGDTELRHSGGVGMLNIAELIAAIAGVVYVIKVRSRWGAFFICWILLAPIAASLTRIGVPHALRSQMALPAWQILAATGAVATVQWVSAARQEAVRQILVLVTLLGAMPFFFVYFGSYAKQSATNWQYGVKQAVEFAAAPHTKDANIYFKYITGAEYLVAYYAGMDRAQFQRFVRGNSRYKIVPFDGTVQSPAIGSPWLQDPGPAMLVTLPGIDWPQGWAAVPVAITENEQTPPELIIFLNQIQVEKMRDQLTQ